MVQKPILVRFSVLKQTVISTFSYHYFL